MRCLGTAAALLLSASCRCSAQATLPQEPDVVGRDDLCLDGSCSLGLLQQRARGASSTEELEMPKVQLELVDEFLRQLNGSSLLATLADPPQGGNCQSSEQPDDTVITDPEQAISAYNFAKPKTWQPIELCLNGPAQSPINICTKTVVNVPQPAPLDTKYKPLSGLEVLNTGHNLQVKGDFGKLTLPDGRSYDAVQYHIHGPSEHTFDHKYAALELHMVHVNFNIPSDDVTDGETTARYSVVGILFDIGWKPNKCIQQMLDTVPRYGCVAPIGLVNFNACFKEQLSGPWYQYRGSFTTPPCTEGVIFNLMERRATITLEQYATFKRLGFRDPSNNRPLQPVNGRIVYYDSL